MADLFSPSAFRIAARLSRSAEVCSSIAALTLGEGSTSLISTLSTFTPQGSVSISNLSLRIAFILSLLEKISSNSMSPTTPLRVV